MTPAEEKALQLTVDLWKELHNVVGNGPTRDADLRELVIPIHMIQRYLFAQDGCRANGGRILGETLRTVDKETGEVVDTKPKAKPAPKKKIEPKPVMQAGMIYTPDCPYNKDVCNISEKEANLSKIRFRQILCADCFRDKK